MGTVPTLMINELRNRPHVHYVRYFSEKIYAIIIRNCVFIFSRQKRGKGNDENPP